MNQTSIKAPKRTVKTAMLTVNTMNDVELRYLNRRGQRCGRLLNHGDCREMDMKEVEAEKKFEWKFQDIEMLKPNMGESAYQLADDMRQ
jgi:hypothetical protein